MDDKERFKRVRRRVEEALRKNTSWRQLLEIAAILNVANLD